MITGLLIENFKAFKSEVLEFRPLTLLTGVNGSGKSTVLQALLLLRQSFRSFRGAPNEQMNLVLNGDYVNIGAGRDAFFRGGSGLLGLGIEWANAMIGTWYYSYNTDRDALASDHYDGPREIIETPLFSSVQFQFLTAERFGPRRTYELSEIALANRDLGTYGQHTAAFLTRYGREEIDEAKHHVNTTDSSLIANLEAWMGEISPGVQFEFHDQPLADAMILRIGFYGGESFRVGNVGFGLSYTLSIVTALLAARAGDLLLIENPEAHLHPQGQVKVGELMARAASAGVQVICESHSDHILNAVRLAAKQKTAGFDHKSVQIHYFSRDREGVSIQSLKIGSDGGLTDWPKGFFDQYSDVSLELL